jgi:glycosyltransferase involved in cell wall biosynthesis
MLLGRLPGAGCPVISHVHELEHGIQRYTTPKTLAYTLRRTSQFIAGSRAVALNLVENHAVDSARLEVVHEFIPAASTHAVRSDESRRRLRSELGIADSAFVAGAAGTMDWRKGYDLFIPLALDVLRSRPQLDAHFVWVGGAWDRYVPADIAYDLRKLGLDRRVHFVGHRSNYLDYMAIFDAFCLTSREDPFPLVVLEAASLEKPVLCFADSGGSPEFIENDCGFVVPYLDVAAMARRLIDLIDNPSLRDEMGQRGRTKVSERHDVAVVGPRIINIIERTLAGRGARG